MSREKEHRFIEHRRIRPHGALGDRPFTTGRCRFLDSDGIRDEPKIYIRAVPGDWKTPILAQLDTGAAWSILDTEIADELGLFDDVGEPTKISTRLGLMEGILVRTPFTLAAEEGPSLRLDATVFISRDWPEGTFLGYGGLLDPRSECPESAISLNRNQ